MSVSLAFEYLRVCLDMSVWIIFGHVLNVNFMVILNLLCESDMHLLCLFWVLCCHSLMFDLM